MEVSIMQRITTSFVLAFILITALAVSPLLADSESVRLTPKVQQIALFKNGLGYFVSRADIPKNQTSFSLLPLGSPAHGTFWLSYPSSVQLKDLVAKEVDSAQDTQAITVPELLKANVGQHAIITCHGKEITGIITFFPDARDKPVPSPYDPGRGTSIIPRPPQPRLMIVQTETDQIALDPYSVTSVQFPSSQALTAFNTKTKTPVLDVKLAKSANGKPLDISYLAKGITWAPSYMVDITDPENARLSAKAVIINEIGDLEDVHIDLVTGFPNLAFADILSPLALKENLAQFLQALNKGQSERRRAGSAVTQQRAYARFESMPAAPTPDYGSAQAGQTAEDLFFYPLENVCLKKDQVGYYPLFTESVPYKHIYQWDIPDYITQDDRYIYGQNSNQPEPEEEIWHSLKLTNTTKVPWTTAPAQTVQKGLILGQDTIKYTPSKGQAMLRITKAMSIKAQQKELETARKHGALEVYGRRYDLVDIEGTLSVENFQDKTITLEITKTVTGQVVSSEPSAKIEKLAKGLQAVNSRSKLTWTIDLEPAQEKKLVYSYKVYVRR